MPQGALLPDTGAPRTDQSQLCHSGSKILDRYILGSTRGSKETYAREAVVFYKPRADGDGVGKAKSRIRYSLVQLKRLPLGLLPKVTKVGFLVFVTLLSFS